MITTTYLAVVAGLALLLWRLRARGRRGQGRHPGVAAAVERVRSALAGAAHADDDLVERMAGALVDHTTTFGSSYAIPGYLGAELPPGVFAAASAARPQLTAEVLDRYQDMMVDRCRRLGRAEFALPGDYVLRLALSCGHDELLLASFEPIVDVRAASAPSRRAPLPVGEHTRVRGSAEVEGGEVTARRDAAEPESAVVLLVVDGMPHDQRRLDARSPVVSVGRGVGSDLQCPDDVHEVSRRHAELTLVDGAVYVTDLGSANGTWIQRDGRLRAVVSGVAEPTRPEDVVWLDEDREVTVTVR